MKNIETSILIQSSIDKIWQTLIGFSQFPQWSSVIDIKGQPSVGECLRITISLNNSKPMVFKPRVIKCDADQEFRWLGKLFNINGLFNGEHYFKLQPCDDGAVELIHGENFTGILLPLLWPMIAKNTEIAFKSFNEDLKKRVTSEQLVNA